MNKQKAVSNHTNADPIWKQYGPAIYIEHVQGGQITEEWVAGQVSKLMAPLSNGVSLMLPNIILGKIEISVSRAVSEFFTVGLEKDKVSPASWVVQMRIFVTDLAAQSKTMGLLDDRWGFFMVQKQNDQMDRTQLFLSLYLYQE